MLGDAESEEHVGQFSRGRLTLGDNLEVALDRPGIVAFLYQKTTGNGLDRQRCRTWIRHGAGGQHAQVLLGRKDGTGSLVDLGCDHDFGKYLDDLFGGGLINGLVGRDDAAKGTDRITAQRIGIGCGQAVGRADAARIGVLDDRNGRLIEFGDQLECGIGVVQVVVGQLLALKLGGTGNARTVAAIHIEGGRLVRVLAIAQDRRTLAGNADPWRRDLVFLTEESAIGKPAGNRCIIGGGAGIGITGKTTAQVEGDATVIGIQLGQECLVILGIGQDSHMGMVLGRRPDHGRAADVDILDTGRVIRTLGDGFLERIEIDHQQVDRCDGMAFHRLQVLRVITQRQQAAMHHRVQGLQTPAHHFREAGVLGNLTDRQTGLNQHLVGATGGQQLNAIIGELAREGHNITLVGDGNQGTLDTHKIGFGQF